MEIQRESMDYDVVIVGAGPAGLSTSIKLKQTNGLWDIRSCTGSSFLSEINPMNMEGLTKERVVSQVKRIINSYYLNI